MKKKYKLALGIFFIIIFIVSLGLIWIYRPLIKDIGYDDTEIEYTILNNNVIIIHNVETLKSFGVSMKPTFTTGNILLVEPYDKEKEIIKEGQIISFRDGRSDSGQTAHRVIASYPKYIITRGDNNLNDERVHIDNVTGIVIGVLYT